MESPRLRYQPIEPACADDLLSLVTDGDVKRYLFDGEAMDRTWCEQAIATSQRTFRSAGLGLWLVTEAGHGDPIGFCGYWTFDELGPDPQLLFAFLPTHAGRGYATEAATALIAAARSAGLTEILSAADEPNTASIRVLRKVGFLPSGSAPGAFGKIMTFRLQL